MIKRRIGVSAWLTAGWLSVNMVRSPSACKASDHRGCEREKRAGGEAGGLHRPSLPTEGGIFHRKVTCEGTGFWPAPRKAPSAGATIANDTLHFLNLCASALGQRHR